MSLWIKALAVLLFGHDGYWVQKLLMSSNVIGSNMGPKVNVSSNLSSNFIMNQSRHNPSDCAAGTGTYAS